MIFIGINENVQKTDTAHLIMMEIQIMSNAVRHYQILSQVISFASFGLQIGSYE